MKTCLYTQTPFTPRSSEHHFATMEAFERFIEEQDPMKTFEPRKREINWGEFERHCTHCGDEYTAHHPAQMYCASCLDKMEHSKGEERKSPLEYYQQQQNKTKLCDKCEHPFIAEMPAMKYCEECSDRGGKRVPVE